MKQLRKLITSVTLNGGLLFHNTYRGDIALLRARYVEVPEEVIYALHLHFVSVAKAHAALELEIDNIKDHYNLTNKC
jgi:hypothetical protein